MWESFKSIAPRAVNKAGIQQEITAQRVLVSAARVLDARWGAEVAKYIQFVSYSDACLVAETNAPAAKQTLVKEQTAFVNAVNHEIGQRAVKKMLIRNIGF